MYLSIYVCMYLGMYVCMRVYIHIERVIFDGVAAYS